MLAEILEIIDLIAQVCLLVPPEEPDGTPGRLLETLPQRLDLRI